MFCKKLFKNTVIVDVSKSRANLKRNSSKKYDYIFSYLCPYLIPKKFLDNTKINNLNFHPGPPKYPGFGCYNYAIFNRDKDYSCTAHIMTKKIDAGPIFQIKKFNLNNNETLESLMKKAYKHLLDLFKKVLLKIKNNKFKIQKIAKWNNKKYTRNYLNNKLSTLKFEIREKTFFNRFIKATINKKMGYPRIIINGYKFIFHEN